MELVTKKRLHLVSGRANLALAEEIAARLGIELGDANLAEFANGELHTRFGESVRGTDVFIIQTHGGEGDFSVNDAIMEQLIMVDAAKRASANSHVVDILIGCYDQVGLLEMSSCVNKTGGVMIMTDSFSTSIFKQSFQRLFAKSADGNLAMAFNATLDVLVRACAVAYQTNQAKKASPRLAFFFFPGSIGAQRGGISRRQPCRPGVVRECTHICVKCTGLGTIKNAADEPRAQGRWSHRGLRFLEQEERVGRRNGTAFATPRTISREGAGPALTCKPGLCLGGNNGVAARVPGNRPEWHECVAVLRHYTYHDGRCLL